MKHIAPWNVEHKCEQCDHGWVCENHPDKPWPSVCDCGAGMPCEGLLADTAAFESEAEIILGHDS
jgi:hypothetical protein